MKGDLKVFKFGGASVKDAASFHQVLHIIASSGSDPLVLVLSAMGKTTNTLESIAKLLSNKEDIQDALDVFIQYHTAIAKDLGLFQSKNFRQEMQGLLQDMEECCLPLKGKSYDVIYGPIVQFGEQFSTLFMHHFLLSHGVQNALLDAREIIFTDMNFPEGNLDWDRTRKAVQTLISPLLDDRSKVLTQGFIASGPEKQTTTLGREGSDFTAAILGAILEAKAVTIWKDVPGVLNADPKEYPEAEPYQYMPYSEAIELAYYGAKVIHSKTIKPLKEKNIPLFVRSFDRLQDAGTLIHGEGENIPPLHSVIRKHGMVLVSLLPRDLSFIQDHRLTDVYTRLAQNNISPDLMQNSALSFSFCTSNRSGLMDKLMELFSADYHVRYNEPTSLLTIRHYTPDVIARYTKGLHILMEQQTRQTYQAVIYGT